MVKDPNCYNGYIAGYWDGVKDSMSGKASGSQTEGIRKLPIQAMAISTRAKNCLKNWKNQELKGI